MSAVAPAKIKPGRLNLEVARLKCVAEAVPPPMEIAEEEVVTDVPAMVAMTVTGPAVLPLCRMVLTSPLFAVEADAGANCSPPPGPFIEKFTGALATGRPFTSLTMNLIVEVSICPKPLIPMVVGFADSNCMLLTAAGDIWTETLPVDFPAVAVIIAVPAVFPAVNVPVACPLKMVAVGVIVPRDALLSVNLTTVPSATLAPLVSCRVTVMLAVPSAVNSVGAASTFMVVGVPTVTPSPPLAFVLIGGSSTLPLLPPPPHEHKTTRNRRQKYFDIQHFPP